MSSRSDSQNEDAYFNQTVEERGNFGFAADDFSDLDAISSAKLQEWTAADFSRIYVRFRPHLIKHAQKFFSNTATAEEVVQDAFLYLMTALPELDSEVGVLRFLKWKTRLLCLDVIRAEGGNPIVATGTLEDSTASTDPDLSQIIERADDAAIVRLALAQLSPRHREAIVATVFEEKSSQQVAQEMGLSENAFRQLLLRARRSFKTVFVGEVEAANLSVSEALTLAAKRHRLKLISGSSLLLVLVAAIVLPPWGSGLLPTLAPEEFAQSLPGAENESLWSASPGLSDIGEPLEKPSVEPLGVASPRDTEAEPAGLMSAGVETFDSRSESGVEVAKTSPANVDDATREELKVLLASEVQENPLRVSDYSAALTNLSNDEMVLRYAVSDNLALIVHTSSCGDNSELRPCKLYFEDSRNGNSLIWLAQTLASEPLVRDGRGTTLDVVATDFLVGDFGGVFGNVAINVSSGPSLEYLRFQLATDGSRVELRSVALIKSGA